MANAYELARDVLSAIDQDRCSFISPAIRTMLLKAWGDGKVEMQNNPHAEEARELIDAERARQDAKWGEQNHDPQVWMAILGEEFGELCQAANELRFDSESSDPVFDADHLLAEAVHTAAVSQAIVECLLRSTWQWPRPPLASTTEVSHG